MPKKNDLLQMTVAESKQRDIGKKRARIGPDAMDYLNVSPGDIIRIIGKRVTCAIVWPADEDEKYPDTIRVDGQTRKNLGVSLNDIVEIEKTDGLGGIPFGGSVADHFCEFFSFTGISDRRKPGQSFCPVGGKDHHCPDYDFHHSQCRNRSLRCFDDGVGSLCLGMDGGVGNFHQHCDWSLSDYRFPGRCVQRLQDHGGQITVPGGDPGDADRFSGTGKGPD